MLALVTGATGLVGSYAVEHLAAAGWEVRALVRTPADAEWLRALGASELVAGDVLDAPSFRRAATRAALVVHGAAAITPRGGWEAFRRPNVDGTAHAIAAAEAVGARLVHVSSVAVYGSQGPFEPGRPPVTEDAPLIPLPDAAFYARSKRESEALVLVAHAAGRLWATAVRPCVVYGRRDRQFVPRLARLYSAGLTPTIGSGGSTLSVVHAANVADAIVAAASAAAAGGRAYNVTEDAAAVTVREFGELAGLGLGRRVRALPVPESVVRAGVRMAGVLASAAGRPGNAAMLESTVSFLTRGNPFSAERARRELGWTPRVAPRQGVVDAFRWYADARGAGAPPSR